MHVRLLAALSLVVLLGLARSLAAAPSAYPEGVMSTDARLAAPKDLNGYFPFTPPKTKAEWETRAEFVRRQVLVALGLWPMPTKTPHEAVVHGRIDAGDYTVEKVYLQSFPGHFVTGNLYRPKGKPGKLPVVLCPHGHWPNGRFMDAGEPAVRKQITEGAERFEDGGRSPLQARCAQLARMGCVVFHYDMLGYADSQQISFDVAHRYGKLRPNMETAENWGLFSPQAESHLQSIMGIQTYNSIRALDWLAELPDVDMTRVGVTGASGGGTQTFLHAAVDPRVTAQFPAVMVSTAMQGGCTCENCSLLRINTGNIELAGLFAPKPLGMAAANDWTKEIMTKGLPELQELYTLLGAPNNVMAKALVHFPHNYNYVSRAVMYSWFNKHLKLGQAEPIVEPEYHRLTAAEMTVWDKLHPAPPSGDDYERSLLKAMTDDSRKQIAALEPKDSSTLAEYRKVVGGGWQTIIGRELPAAGAVEWKKIHEDGGDGYLEFAGLVKYTAKGEEVPTIFLHPENWNQRVVIWIDGRGKQSLYNSDGSLNAEVAKLVKAGTAVASCDVLGIGEAGGGDGALSKNRKVKTERQFAGFTYGYNHPLLAQRTHDILSLISMVRNYKTKPARVDLVGGNGGGIWVAAAAAIAGDQVDRVVIDTQGFRFNQLKAFDDAEFVPGAGKYGDVPGLLSLVAPHACLLLGEKELPAIVTAAYQAAGKGDAISTKSQSIAEWLGK